MNFLYLLLVFLCEDHFKCENISVNEKILVFLSFLCGEVGLCEIMPLNGRFNSVYYNQHVERFNSFFFFLQDRIYHNNF